MDDFNSELFEGMPDELDEEQREQLRREEQRLQEELAKSEQTTQTQPKPEATATGQPKQQPQPTQPKPEPEPAKAEEGEEPQDFYGLKTEFQEDEIPPTSLQTTAEVALALPTSAIDFGVDLFNLVPGVDLPKIPKFENDVVQTVREISSIVLPTVGLGGAGGAVAGKAALASKSKFLADPLVKWIGTTAMGAGTGAFVDYTVELSQEDDNLAGVLKKNWPLQMGWIPDNVATLDSDSPDTKRLKNVLEGVYLGVGTDVLLGVAKLLQLTKGFRTTYIPKTEQSGRYFEKNVPVDVTPEDAVNRSAGKRELATDEVGKFNFDKAVNLNGPERALDEPLWGVHDLYGYQETGIRSVDDLGIAGASVDAYRVRNDIASTNGRVGSIVSESFIKNFNSGDFDTNVMLRGVKQDMLEADEFDVKLADGTYITAKQIAENGETMASESYMIPLPQLKTMFNNLATEVSGEMGVRTLSSVGMEAARKLMKRYFDDFINMDAGKAQAYLETSIAGQISDTAMGMRLVEGTPAIERAQEQILDRIQFLMAMRGRAAYVRGRALNMTNMWNRLTSPGSDANKAAYAKRVQKAIKEEGNATLAALKAIELDAGLTVDTLREISQDKPEMLAPLMMAYEFTDGNINTIAGLNKFLKESTGTIRKALIDKEPGIPSVIVQGFYANLYNSTLSAFATPIKAGLSNFAGLIEKPIGNYVGALRYNDKRLIKRGWYQYFNNLEVLQNSFDYMKQVFKRSATEADVAGLQRDDLFVKNKKQLEILDAFAAAKAEQGDYGPQVMMQQVHAMNDLAMHPWLRFGNRSMQALDGFVQAMIANAEARGRAFDEVTNFGRKEFDKVAAEQVYQKAYREMFDENGLITDSAVRYTAGEISLNLDNEANNALSNLIRRAPVLKPFLLFTKTPLNELKLMGSYTPLGKFVKGLNDFDLPVEQLSDSEIVEKLSSRGININSNDPQAYINKYNEIRADFRGRRALGELAVISAVGLMMSDRLTGNGLYNKQKQRLRRDADWKPRSIRLPGGNWVSYDNLGPITNWLALTADVMDNFDSLSPNDVGEQLRKLGFVFASSFTDKTYLAGLEPFLDVIRGDVGAMNRWGASFLSSATIRGSSQMAEISRLMDPGLKVVENDLLSLIQNRLPLAKGTLPPVYDYIDGGEVGVPGNFISRVWNTYMPWKVNGKISREKQFLIDIEYDARPTLSTNGKGVRLTAQEKSDITNQMGKDELFKQAIEKVMSTTLGKQFRKEYKQWVSEGLPPDLSKFKLLHTMLDSELRNAINMAAAAIPGNDRITRKLMANQIFTEYSQRGDQEGAKQYLEYIKKQGFTY